MNSDNLPAVIPKEVVKEKEVKILSKRQQLWLNRSHILWRLKGLPYLNRYGSSDTLTIEEQDKLDLIEKLRKELITDFTANSIKLGFNAKYRCWCGKEAIDYIDAMWLCKEHKKFV